ncbi:ribosomal protein S16 [Russula dissimulans]|nr:ribosomal protein S16 [Russula dissimulans]
MPVRLRFSLHGNRNNRIFHLVATDLRKRRDAKPIELLGIYDPRLRLGQEHKTVHWSVERIKYWLEKGGALPSKPVVKLLERGGIIPPNSKYHPKSRGALATPAPSSEPDNVPVSPPSARPSPT